jgi:Ca-activated chloride channel family protein
MTEFRFAHPIAFLILLLPVLLFILSRGSRQPTSPVMRYSDIRLMSGLASTWRVRLRRIPDVLRLAAWVLLIIALARPQNGRAQEIIRGRGIDIALALDISGSMGAPDFAPSTRLDAAKSVIDSFIAGREYDRIGLVVFARNAYIQAPPTLDYAALSRSLDEVTLITEIGLEDGTAIGLGLATAANMLRDSDATSKIIILLTDGDNNTALDPIAAAQAVTAFGIRVYTIGMGQPGSAELNEAALQRIALIAGGLYFRAQDLTDLQHIYERIDTLERSDVSRQVFVRWQDQATAWMIAALILLLIERILRHTAFQTVP